MFFNIIILSMFFYPSNLKSVFIKIVIHFLVKPKTFQYSLYPSNCWLHKCYLFQQPFTCFFSEISVSNLSFLLIIWFLCLMVYQFSWVIVMVPTLWTIMNSSYNYEYRENIHLSVEWTNTLAVRLTFNTLLPMLY